MVDYKISCCLLPSGGMPEEQREALKTRGLIPLAGELVTISIKKIGKNRTARQNAYWFAVLDKYVIPELNNPDNPTNWNSYKLHCGLMHLLGYEDVIIMPDGQVVCERQKSSRFDTVEWEEYMQKAREFIARQYAIQIPLPNEDLLYKQYFPEDI